MSSSLEFSFDTLLNAYLEAKQDMVPLQATLDWAVTEMVRQMAEKGHVTNETRVRALLEDLTRYKGPLFPSTPLAEAVQIVQQKLSENVDAVPEEDLKENKMSSRSEFSSLLDVYLRAKRDGCQAMSDWVATEMVKKMAEIGHVTNETRVRALLDDLTSYSGPSFPSTPSPETVSAEAQQKLFENLDKVLEEIKKE